MDKAYRKIGISGGTFDPIHHGHLIIAEEIRERLDLEKIVFVPAGVPPHKDNSKVTAAEHRFNMVCSAVKTNPHFEVSRIELERGGYTYTIDTLKQLKAVYGKNTRLCFITGADVIPELLTWKDYEELFKVCELITVARPGYKKDRFVKEVEYLNETYGARINIQEAPLIGISSTEIRDRVGSGRTIRYLVPEEVEKYIYDNGLYKQVVT